MCEINIAVDVFDILSVWIVTTLGCYYVFIQYGCHGDSSPRRSVVARFSDPGVGAALGALSH